MSEEQHRALGVSSSVAVGLWQFAAGASLASGLVGALKGGRDLWFGLVLIVLAALFGLRGVALDDQRKRKEADLLRAQLTAAITTQQRPAMPAQPEGSLRRWLRRFGA